MYCHLLAELSYIHMEQVEAVLLGLDYNIDVLMTVKVYFTMSLTLCCW